MTSIADEVQDKLLSCSSNQNNEEICLPTAPTLYTQIEGEPVIGLTADIFVDNSAWRARLFEQYSAQV